MTFSEFKAWLDGYSEGFSNNAPSAKQWEKVKDKLAEVDAAPMVYPNVPLYPWYPRPEWIPYTPTYPTWTSTNITYTTPDEVNATN